MKQSLCVPNELIVATKLVHSFAFVPSELRLLVPALTYSDYTSASRAHIFTCSEQFNSFIMEHTISDCLIPISEEQLDYIDSIFEHPEVKALRKVEKLLKELMVKSNYDILPF